MKKSKIIIPAAAILALSVGAGVTGTVAWFSANRVATIKGTFQANDAEGALHVKGTAGIGTTTTDTTYTNSSAISVEGLLTHGSYNAVADGTGKLYVASISEGSDGAYQIDGYEDHKTIADNTGTKIDPSNYPWQAGTTSDDPAQKIWYGVSWKLSVKLASAGNASATKMVFVDFNKTDITDKTDVNKGFRLAVMDGIHAYIIGADNQTNHVIGTTTGDVDAWEKYHQFGETYTKVKDNDSKAGSETEDKGFLFELSGTEAKEITCVAWYEGEDTNVVSDTNNTFTATSLTLSLYARQTVND